MFIHGEEALKVNLEMLKKFKLHQLQNILNLFIKTQSNQFHVELIIHLQSHMKKNFMDGEKLD